MKIRHLRRLFVGLLSVVFLGSMAMSFSGAEPISFGLSAGWTNGRYTYSAGTSPMSMGFALVVLCLYTLLMAAEPNSPGKPFPGVARRFFAFWFDFIFSLFATAPFAGILPVLLECRRTHLFQWSFERDTPAPGDAWIAGVTLFLTFLVLALYYAFPLTRSVPSPGACVLGYQIVCDDGQAMTMRNALLRTVLGFIAAAAWYLAPFIARDRNAGKFWLDKVFRTHAVHST